MDRGLELFMSIHKDLAQSKVWEPPRVFINTTVGPSLIQQLTEIVKRHQGAVVESVEDATHIVYPPPLPNPNPEGKSSPQDADNSDIHMYAHKHKHVHT